jgi:hypothetical protein
MLEADIGKLVEQGLSREEGRQLLRAPNSLWLRA